MRWYKIAMMCVCLFVGTHHAVARQAKQVTFTGRILDDRGRPVAEAKVTAYEMHSDGIAGNILLQPAGEITTAEDGAFIFTAPPKPERSAFFECIIVAIKSDLAVGWTDWTMREDAKADIQLGAPEKLRGVIVDETNKSVPGAEVRVNLSRTVKTTGGKEKRIWLPGIAPLQELGTKTDGQGGFFFENLPSEVSVDLLVKAKGRATIYTYKQEPREPAFKAGQKDIKVVLPAEARIEGKIVDPDTGKGIAGTQFAVVDPSGLFYYRFVHTTNEDGTFSIGGLQSNRYVLRGGGLPRTYVDVKSGQTSKVTIPANKPYYVRILFGDGSPLVVKPEPWPGAKTKISFVEEGGRSQSVVTIDDKGFSKVYLSQEQYRKARVGKAWFEVTIPYTDTRGYYEEDVFVYNLLSTDKAKAGAVKITKLGIESNSLMGKPLPDLKEFGIDLSRKNSHNNQVLVCFWDMNQRPSRNCLLQLAKHAEELKRNEVVVVAVQTSKVKKNDLDAWSKKNHIPLPVGMIRGDEKKTRFRLGVQSLPWLILTDCEHQVVAEGFALSELNDRIANVRKDK